MSISGCVLVPLTSVHRGEMEDEQDTLVSFVKVNFS